MIRDSQAPLESLSDPGETFTPTEYISRGMTRTVTMNQESTPHSRGERRTMNALWWTMAGGLFFIPLVIDPLAKDPFRFPKEIAFRLFAIVTAAILATLWTFRKRPFAGWKSLSRIHLLALLAVGWTLVTTITSTNRALSVDSFITVVSSAIIFTGARVAVRHRPSMRSFDIVLPAALMNALLAITQEFGLWQPFNFPTEYQGHALTTAFLGNPNDVAMYLVFPAIATVIAMITDRHRSRKIGYMIASLVLLFGLFACGSRAALAAWTLTVLVATAKWDRRSLLWTLLALAVVTAAFSTKFRERFVNRTITAILDQRYDVLFSERLPAVLTAIEMTRDHPISGVGPGTFKWNYFKYRLEIGDHYPDRWTRGAPATFRETHNDHLQILCETGVPGYSVFALALGTLLFGVRMRQNPSDDLERNVANRAPVLASSQFGTFTERLSLPVCLVLVVIMLTQFPLQIAGARVVVLYLCALCTWRYS